MLDITQRTNTIIHIKFINYKRKKFLRSVFVCLFVDVVVLGLHLELLKVYLLLLTYSLCSGITSGGM